MKVEPPASCPWCEKSTVTRTNGHTGKKFTGCSAWPLCRWSMEGIRTNPADLLDHDGAFLARVRRDLAVSVGDRIEAALPNGPRFEGTVVGKLPVGNLLLRIDEKCEFQGFKYADIPLGTVPIEENFRKNCEQYTYWIVPPEFAAKISEKDEKTPNHIEKISSSTKKETNMSSNLKKNAFQIAKSDGKEAAYRIAGKRLSTGANQLLTKAIKNTLGAEHSEAVEAIMQSPAGTMLTQLVLGWGLTYMPGPAQDARIQKLAEEFRVQGTATGMDLVAGNLLEHLAPFLNEALEMLPGLEKTTGPRVEETEVTSLLSVEEEQELSEVLPEKKKAVRK